MLFRLAAPIVLVALLAGLAIADFRIPPGFGPCRRPVDTFRSLRDLCMDAPVIVLAVPVDSVIPLRFRVTEVLRGKGIKVHDEVAPPSLTVDRVRTFEEGTFTEGKPQPRRIERALLFLKANGKGWTLIQDGFRFCTEKGQTLAPTQRGGKLKPYQPARWSVIVRRLREDIAAVDQLMSYRRIGLAERRVQAVLSWVQQRRGEFTAGPGTDEAPVGWGRLQMDVFDWIFASASPEDAWPAVQLYAELNHNEIPRFTTPVFSTPTGRSLLVRIAQDEKRLTGERVRALRVLQSRLTLWPNAEECKRGGEVMTTKEQETIIEQLTPLLSTREEDLGVALAQTLLRLSQPEQGSQRSTKAIPALIAAYKDSRPGPAHDELAFTVASLVPASEWKDLNDNPPGVVARFRDLERKDNTLTFWLEMRTPGPAVFEAPQLVLEKLGTFGFVSETKRLPLTVLHLEGGWAAGWKGEALAVTVALTGLKERSTYKIRVEGYIGQGKDRRKWKSEPRKFYVPKQQMTPPPGYPGYRGMWK